MAASRPCDLEAGPRAAGPPGVRREQRHSEALGAPEQSVAAPLAPRTKAVFGDSEIVCALAKVKARVPQQEILDAGVVQPGVGAPVFGTMHLELCEAWRRRGADSPQEVVRRHRVKDEVLQGGEQGQGSGHEVQEAPSRVQNKGFNQLS